MINILINVWFPVEKGNEVYKKMLEIDKIIPFPTAAAVESEKGRTLIGKDVSDFLL